MTYLIPFWNALNKQVPKDFVLKPSATLTTFSQELMEKLEVVGRLDALLINPP